MCPILFHIGPLTFHSYGFLVAVAFLAAYQVARKLFPINGLAVELTDKFSFIAMAFGLLGARILYFAVYGFRDLKGDPLSFFRVWEGGLVIYGAVLAGLAALVVAARRNRVSFFSITDAFAAPLLLGQAIGRLGCFAAGCCYGKPTNGWWGVQFKDPNSLAPLFQTLHPTQIYDAAGNFILFLIAYKLAKKPLRRGLVTAFYCISQGAFRFAIEYVRFDDRGMGAFGFSPSQLIGLLLIATGVVITIYVKRQEA